MRCKGASEAALSASRRAHMQASAFHAPRSSFSSASDGRPTRCAMCRHTAFRTPPIDGATDASVPELRHRGRRACRTGCTDARCADGIIDSSERRAKTRSAKRRAHRRSVSSERRGAVPEASRNEPGGRSDARCQALWRGDDANHRGRRQRSPSRARSLLGRESPSTVEGGGKHRGRRRRRRKGRGDATVGRDGAFARAAERHRRTHRRVQRRRSARLGIAAAAARSRRAAASRRDEPAGMDVSEPDACSRAARSASSRSAPRGTCARGPTPDRARRCPLRPAPRGAPRRSSTRRG